MNVTFFGHRDSYHIPINKLYSILIDLIKKQNASTFYVGCNGNFDSAVISTLYLIKKQYSHIEYYVVLAYMPKADIRNDFYNHHPTILPEEVAAAAPKFAINVRNNWMIEHSDFVITFVNRNFGGAAKFKKIAIKKGKTVIELN